MDITKYAWGKHLYRLLTGKKPGEANGGMVNKTYAGTDDSFFEEASETLRDTLQLDHKKERDEKDLKKYGTRMRLMDVADDTIPNNRRKEILPLKQPVKPKRFPDSYKKDLKRYGTSRRVIDVANDELRQAKKQEPFPIDFSKALREKFMSKHTVHETTPYAANPYSEVFREFPKLQVTIRNTSGEDKEVTLWGSSGVFTTEAPTADHVEFHAVTAQISVPTGIHPQGIVYNPANEKIFVANQISGTVSVVNSDNTLDRVVQLTPELPGFSSPVALAVNTNIGSLHYGLVYVACSVSNTIAVIDPATLNLIATVTVGVRPVAIAFNPVNTSIYITNLVSNTLTVMDAESLIEAAGSPFHTGVNPIGVGVNPENGEVYVANSLDNSVSVFSHENVLITTIPEVGIYPTSVTYNPANHSMYTVATNSNKVYQIDPFSHVISTTLATGTKPYHSFFDSDNNFLYVQNRQDNTFTIIRPDNSKIDGISVGEQNIGGAFNPFNHSIYISDTAHNTINVIGYLDTASFFEVSPDYASINEEFKSNPAIIQHVKFVVSGQNRLYSFRRNRFTPTGSNKSRTLSFEMYASPQSHLNVAEVFELAGTLIDRKMNWRFMLPGLHTVTILLWYRQIEVRDFLTQNFYTPTFKTSKLQET